MTVRARKGVGLFLDERARELSEALKEVACDLYPISWDSQLPHRGLILGCLSGALCIADAVVVGCRLDQLECILHKLTKNKHLLQYPPLSKPLPALRPHCQSNWISDPAGAESAG